MVMTWYLLKGFNLGFAAAMLPGPFQAYLLSQTMKNGWQRTLPAVLAPLLSDGPIIVLVLSVLTQVPEWFLSVIQVVGGLFILYLAWGAFRSFRHTRPALEATTETTTRSLLKAILVNVFSPGPWIFWSTVTGPLLLEGWRDSIGAGVGFVTMFYATFIGCLGVLVALFALARRSGPAVMRVLTGVSALVLLLFGLSQLWAGVVRMTS
ncbi:MAG: LysE family transporter [Chloroflexaceae bacterium]|nr:LysE family transporter [Chloroflexaceae bacterium]